MYLFPIPNISWTTCQVKFCAEAVSLVPSSHHRRLIGTSFLHLPSPAQPRQGFIVFSIIRAQASSHTMESNKDEALKCLRIAQKHRDAGNFPSARKFCQKSLSLFATPEAELLKQFIESAAAAAASAGPSSSTGTSNATSASSSSTETHPSASGAKRRGDAKAEGTAGGMNGEKREYTAEQLNVVKRVRACKPTDYYEILGVKKDCEEAEIKKAYRKVYVLLVSRGVGY